MRHRLIKLTCITLSILSISMPAKGQSRNNFFKDIKSIDVEVAIKGDASACNISDSDVRSSVSFVLSNTPLRKIDSMSPDVLYFNILILTPKISGRSVGCTVGISTEFWRMAEYKGRANLVTVWSSFVMVLSPEAQAQRQLRESIEDLTKDFVSKWTEQR